MMSKKKIETLTTISVHKKSVMIHALLDLMVAVQVGFERLLAFPGQSAAFSTTRESVAFRVATLFLSVYAASKNVLVSLGITTLFLSLLPDNNYARTCLKIKTKKADTAASRPDGITGGPYVSNGSDSETRGGAEQERSNPPTF